MTFDHVDDPRCQQVVVINSTSILTCDTYEKQLASNNSDQLQIERCVQDNIVFDQSIVLTSVTQDYSLTCQHAIVRSIFNSLYLGGMLLGSFSIGLISDNYGRKKVSTTIANIEKSILKPQGQGSVGVNDGPRVLKESKRVQKVHRGPQGYQRVHKRLQGP